VSFDFKAKQMGLVYEVDKGYEVYCVYKVYEDYEVYIVSG